MLTFDTRDFERASRRMGALSNQIPFALAGALNASAEVARKEDLPAAWAESITARNKTFVKAALTLKGGRATKRNLRVVVRDQYGRGNLKLHDEGGTRRPRGAAIAVPNKTNLQPKRGSHGVPKGLRPRAVPNSFVKPSKFGPVLFQRVGTGKDRHLKAMYGLAPAVPVRRDVPFHAAFRRSMLRSMPREFRVAMGRAMATARKTR